MPKYVFEPPASFADLVNPHSIDKDYIAHMLARQENVGGRLHRIYNRVSGLFSPDLPITVTYISDNGNYADAARAEIQKRLYDINAILTGYSGIKSPDVVYQDIPSQDWRAGSFDLAQPARETVRGPGNILFVNCAPRLKQRGLEKDNGGEKVYAGMLRNGTIVAAVSEYSFALFRDIVEKGDLALYPVNVQTKGSQFRSRDFFTWFTQVLAVNMRRHARDWQSGMSVEARHTLLEKLNFINTSSTLPVDHIPDLSSRPQIIRVDTHGNLKLSIRNTDIPQELMGRDFEFSLRSERGVEKGSVFTSKVAENMFDTKSGEIGIAPGSSGNWPDTGLAGSRFLEMAKIGSSLRESWGLKDQELKEGLYLHIRDAETGRAYPFKNRPAAIIA